MTAAILRGVPAGAIVAYQRYVSPYKGFRCAYRAHTGGWSCSEYARRLILRCGPGALWQGLPRQFARCKLAYAVLAMSNAEKPEPKKKQDKRSGWSNCGAEAAYNACMNMAELPFRPIPKTLRICDRSCGGCAPGPCDLGPCDCSW